MENYIVINGKKAELTEEQLKMLGITTEKKNPFARCEVGEIYYLITTSGNVDDVREMNDSDDNSFYNIANYCTDKDLLQQRAWHETLNRLLWRYSMEHDGDKIEWNNDPMQNKTKALIYYNHIDKKFDVITRWDFQYFGAVWFNTYEIAENAIKEIIEPFMAEHPNFVW